MAAATDFLYDEALVDALCSELRDHLPVTWTRRVTQEANKFFALRRGPEFGDLRDYRQEPDESWKKMCPLIFCKVVSNAWDRERSGLGGKTAIRYQMRVVHMWSAEQCHNEDTGAWIEPARARCQRLKVMNTALFNAARRNLGNPTLTNADGLTATVNVCEFAGAFLEGIEDIDTIPARLYAVAVDLSAVTTTR